MMIKINLLSDRDKEERQLEEKLGTVLRAGLSLVLALLILSGLLFSFETVLGIDLKSAQNETKAHPSPYQKEIDLAEELLKNANTAAGKVNSAAREMPYWSKILQNISADVPDGLNITSIHIEKAHMKILGFSKTRDAFLAFQEKLKGDGFSNLNSPISNLVSPENFSFSVEVDVDSKYLNEPQK